MPISGLVVLVTGAARGMGREYVRAFLKEGAKVIAADRSWAPTGVSNDDYEFLNEIKDDPNVLPEVMDITIDSHVKSLRRKLGEAGGDPGGIETVRGVGYRINDSPSGSTGDP